MLRAGEQHSPLQEKILWCVCKGKRRAARTQRRQSMKGCAEQLTVPTRAHPVWSLRRGTVISAFRFSPSFDLDFMFQK